MDALLSQQEERYEKLREISSFEKPIQERILSIFPNAGEEVILDTSPKFSCIVKQIEPVRDVTPRKIFSEINFDYSFQKFSNSIGGLKAHCYSVYKNFMVYTCEESKYIYLIETTTQNLRIESYLYVYLSSNELISIKSYSDRTKLTRPFIFETLEVGNFMGEDPDESVYPFVKTCHYLVNPDFERGIFIVQYIRYYTCAFMNKFAFDFNKAVFLRKNEYPYTEPSRLTEESERCFTDRYSYSITSMRNSIELRLRGGCVCETLFGTNLVLKKYSFSLPIHSFIVAFRSGEHFLIVKEYRLVHPLSRRQENRKISLLRETMEILHFSEKEEKNLFDFVLRKIILSLSSFKNNASQDGCTEKSDTESVLIRQ